jgi:hypothetical protein
MTSKILKDNFKTLGNKEEFIQDISNLLKDERFAKNLATKLREELKKIQIDLLDPLEIETYKNLQKGKLEDNAKASAFIICL